MREQYRKEYSAVLFCLGKMVDSGRQVADLFEPRGSVEVSVASDRQTLLFQATSEQVRQQMVISVYRFGWAHRHNKEVPLGERSEDFACVMATGYGQA